jgi:hypothetical protein
MGFATCAHPASVDGIGHDRENVMFLRDEMSITPAGVGCVVVARRIGSFAVMRDETRPETGPARGSTRGASGTLAGPLDGPERLSSSYPAQEGRPGLRMVHRASGFAGTLVTFGGDHVIVRGPTGLERQLKNAPGDFLVDSRAVRLVPALPTPEPAPAAPSVPDHLARARVSTTAVTASGSRAVIGASARVARASRILVEGVHDAELVEKVWGDDLRVEGIVVERLDGLDHLDAVLAEIRPARDRRIGVLVDHLVPGSKEMRVAEAISEPCVLVTGTPYVDVWEAIRPAVVGVDAWPVVPKGQPWKEGVCAALGVESPPELWRRILGATTSWKHLEQPFIRAVEELIDFVTAAR